MLLCFEERIDSIETLSTKIRRIIVDTTINPVFQSRGLPAGVIHPGLGSSSRRSHCRCAIFDESSVSSGVIRATTLFVRSENRSLVSKTTPLADRGILY
jgi:hypothetical protein